MVKTPPTVQQSEQGIALSGVICFETVMSVYQAGLALLTQQSKVILIDLREVSHKDSSILALLSAWIRYTMRQEKQLYLINLPESLQHLMQLSGLEKVFPVKALSGQR